MLDVIINLYIEEFFAFMFDSEKKVEEKTNGRNEK